MASVLRHTMVVRNPETLEATALLEGSEVPDWATDLVDAENLTDGPAAGDGDQYDAMGVADLKSEIDKRNEDRDADDQLSKSGNKAELQALLREDDASDSA